MGGGVICTSWALQPCVIPALAGMTVLRQARSLKSDRHPTSRLLDFWTPRPLDSSTLNALPQRIEYHRHASRNVFPRNVFRHALEKALAVAGLPHYLQRGRRMVSSGCKWTLEGKLIHKRFFGHAARASATETLQSGGGVNASTKSSLLLRTVSEIKRLLASRCTPILLPRSSNRSAKALQRGQG